MAEGFCRHLKGDLVLPMSAGIEKQGLNPRTVEVMREKGIDISGHHSKTLDKIDTGALDYVVTVCGHAHETCPVFSGNAKVVHRGFDDPPALAMGAATEEEALIHYRRVRDEIEAFVLALPGWLRRQ